MKDRIHISVTSLVESVLRSGDLHSGHFVPLGPDNAVRLHRQVQASRPQEYTPEAPVAFQVETPSLILEICGRIDGVWRCPGRVVIEEIKTTAASLDSIEAAENPVHWGQLKTYAFLYAVRHDLKKIETQLTYVHSPSGQVKEFRRSYTRDDLQAFSMN
ncbi:MAG: PD-(D/E)XK nuclease family protein [Pseudomonadota bacterium]